MADRVYNFSPGPATLPLGVLQEAQRDLLALPGIGVSALEVSHRSPWFLDVMQEATENLRALLKLPQGYSVLYLQGGSRLQFSMAPMNFLRGSGRTADYLLTGSWAKQAIVEARREGEVHVAFDNQEENYRRLPAADEAKLTPDAAYVYFTSNETIQGVQFQTEPESGGVPLVCDASSDFLWRPIDLPRYGLIFACAQKNLGPAGVTVVIVRDELLGRIPDGLHSMLDYRVYQEQNSLANTPCVFGVYVMMLVTRWLRNDIGGLEQMERLNRQKAALLYEALDEHPDRYEGHAEPSSRSMMNVTFRLPSDERTQQFLSEATDRGLVNLKGHRSVGGVRASIYNAMPLDGVEALREFMLEFAAK